MPKKAILVEVSQAWSKDAFQAEIIPGESISILKGGVLKNTFKVGDEAEYDSYNLRYTGPITSISKTTVCVEKGGGKRAFMKLASFCWRNADFDAEKVAAENADTMMYI